ncbi:MAG: single-stranded-DNA-specific exonuclease RecJ [Firmicutes bacterium]|nr:single-stranded-DNA-specific exonuclease RecJ [Bacillota bacterium]
MKPVTKVWRVKTQHPLLQHIMARELNISRVTAQLLINRGIYTVEQARAFFSSQLNGLHDPGLLKDLERAVLRLERAIKEKEKILVYGDYDADGVTATALLVRAIRRLGGDAAYYLPDRLAEGYGLHLEPLQKAVAGGVSLVVTVDCGISAMAEARWASENAVDLIITDHHETPEDLPPAFAVINPKRRDCSYPFKELAGAGVALKLVQALFRRAGLKPGAWLDYLDLACLGTVADIVPLTGENRLLVKHGLPAIAAAKNPGLAALLATSGLKKDKVRARDVGFVLAPRLNAAGRMGSAGLALELLLTDSPEKALAIAGELQRVNQERQQVETAVFHEALELSRQPQADGERVLVLAKEGWHPGVVGIVASRLLELYYRPVVLISVAEGKGRGSARSVPGFNIYRALACCREYLTDFGGHTAAAGFSIEPSRIGAFRRAVNEYAAGLNEDLLVPRLEVDTLISLDDVSERLIEEIDLLHPFGHQNPAPLLGARGISVLDSRGVGKDAAHLKLRLKSCDRSVLDGIGFRLGAYAGVVAARDEVDLAFVPNINEYNGHRSVQIEVRELGLPAVLDLSGDDSGVGGFLADLFRVDCIRLESANRSLFAPEFVLQVLEMLGEGGNTQCLKVDGDPGEDFLFHRSGDNIISTTGGDGAGRPAFLLGAAARPEPSIVLVSCGYQAVELAHFANLSCPSARGKVLYCHRGMSREERQMVWDIFLSGQARLVVTTALPRELKAGFVKNFILYHLPFSPLLFAGLSGRPAPAARLHVLCQPADLADNRRYLEALAPERDLLAAFYQYLRREAGGAAAITIDYPAAARALARSGFPSVQDYTVEVAVHIFSELGLVEAQRREGACRLALRPAPAQKKELAGASTFRLCHRLKENTNRWMERFWKNVILRDGSV